MILSGLTIWMKFFNIKLIKKIVIQIITIVINFLAHLNSLIDNK
jgi:hypothetical protein